jgi:hypothetical protein
MPVFDAYTLQRYFNEGETELSVDKPFLCDRISLGLSTGVSVYTLPDYVLSIKRITILGQGLDPLPRRNEREVFQKADQRSKPFWYIYNNIGLNTIKLFPVPGSDLLAVSGDLWGDDAIRTGCIVEFYRTADFSYFIVPVPLRRQLLKRFTASRAFRKEGAGQNLKVAQYFVQQWEAWKNDYYTLLSDLYSQPRRFVINDYNTFNWFPGSPIYPIDRFGISVDRGE